MDPEKSFNSQSCEGIYRKKRAMRGGGDGGSNDWTNSVGDMEARPVMMLTGLEMATGSGRTKITAVVRNWLLSWEQEIEQSAMPLPP